MLELVRNRRLVIYDQARRTDGKERATCLMIVWTVHSALHAAPCVNDTRAVVYLAFKQLSASLLCHCAGMPGSTARQHRC